MAKSDRTPKQEAIELVQMLEQRNGDPHAIQSELRKKHEVAARLPDEDRIREYRKLEIARAYIEVSDGKGGVDLRNSHKNEIARFRAAEAGFMSDGRTLLPSQREAIDLKRPDLLTEDARQRFPNAFRAQAAKVEVGVLHGNEGARPRAGYTPPSAATERVGVSMAGSGPSRGFARVSLLAATAALTAIAIPALRHLGVDMKPDESGIRMASLSNAASGLHGSEPANNSPQHAPSEPLLIHAAILRNKPPAGPN